MSCAGHLIMCWTSDAGKFTVPPDSAIQNGYVAVTGAEGAAYDPATGANDNGCAILDVLNYWRNPGIYGHCIDSYGAVNPKNVEHVKQGVFVLGGLDTGVQLPIAARRPEGFGTCNRAAA